MWAESKVAEWLEDEDNFGYLADDGFVVYNWHDSDLRIDEIVAGSAATARALWATVGSGSSIATNVQAYIAPNDPVHLLVNHEADKQTQLQRWMLRVLDAPAAIAARGFAPGATVEVDLELEDLEVGGNTGRWHLSVADGSGSLTPSTGSRRHPAPRLPRPRLPVRRYAARCASPIRPGVGWFGHRGRADRHGLRRRHVVHARLLLSVQAVLLGASVVAGIRCPQTPARRFRGLSPGV